MRSSKIPFIILIIMMIEIGLFITVGGSIGVALTLAMVIVTSIIGSILLRVQGVGVLNQLRQEIESKGTPGLPMVHGFMIMVAGFLLLVPGFFTDSIGFLLFIPPVRTGLWKLLGRNVVVRGSKASSAQSHDWHRAEGTGQQNYSSSPEEKVIELNDDEFERKNNSSNRSDSPWSK